MSTYSIEKLPGEPIILNVLTAEFSGRDVEHTNRENLSALDAAEEPLFLVIDMSRANFSLDDILYVSSAAARGENVPLHHPMLREFVVASEKQWLRLAAKGLSSDVFGNVNVKVFDTVDEALAYCRS